MDKEEETKKIIRYLVLGRWLYKDCMKNGEKIEKSELENRLKELQNANYFTNCKVEDLVKFCSLKETPNCMNNTSIEDLLKLANIDDLMDFIGFRNNPFYNLNLPDSPLTNFLPRDEYGKPFRQCDLEKQEKIETEDTSPILRLRDKHKIIEHYVCDMGQTHRTEEVKEWMKENYELSKNYRYALSEQTFFWLKDYISGYAQMGKTDLVMEIPSHIKAELQQFRLKKPIKAYRGIHFDMNNINTIKQFCIYKHKPGYYYEYIDDRASSWTWNYQIAENFGKLGSFNYILKCIFKPDDILIDCRLLNEYCDMIGKHRLQDEIIILPGKYKCEVYEAPFNKNELLNEENIHALTKISSLIETINLYPKKGRYAGYIGGLYGSIILNPSKKFIEEYTDNKMNNEVRILFEFRRDADKYAVDYCVLSLNTKKEYMKDIGEWQTRNVKQDPKFYEFVNSTMKYLKHYREDYMDAYLGTYDMNSPKCKDKCDEEYRNIQDYVSVPYTYTSNTLDEIVNAFISDVMVLDRSLFMNKVCDYRIKDTSKYITELETMIVLEPLRLIKNNITPSISRFTMSSLLEKTSSVLRQSSSLSALLFILDKIIFMNVDFINRDISDYIINECGKYTTGNEQDIIVTLILVNLMLLYNYNKTSKNTIKRAIQGMKVTKKGLDSANNFCELMLDKNITEFLKTIV